MGRFFQGHPAALTPRRVHPIFVAIDAIRRILCPVGVTSIKSRVIHRHVTRQTGGNTHQVVLLSPQRFTLSNNINGKVGVCLGIGEFF